MKSATLPVWLSFVALLCVSCDGIVVAQQGAAYPGGQERILSCAFNPDKVVELKPGFRAATYGQCPWHSIGHPCPNYPEANPNPTLPPGRLASIQDSIVNAVNNAPQHLRDEICTVSNIFIDNDSSAGNKNSSAWGMLDRSRTDDQNRPLKYIGIRNSMFDVPDPPYASLETAILQKLLKPSPNPPPAWLRSISHVATPDYVTTRTMAILAHEMGHIIWWNESIPAVKCPAINGTWFQAITWQTPISLLHGFHSFGLGQVDQSKLNDFTEGDMVINLRNGDITGVVSQMKEVYQFGNWINLFSFVAPDEDFIETYKFWVLTNATAAFKLQSLTLYFNEADGVTPVTAPIVSNGSFGAPNSNLEKKRAWIEQWVARGCAP